MVASVHPVAGSNRGSVSSTNQNLYVSSNYYHPLSQQPINKVQQKYQEAAKKKRRRKDRRNKNKVHPNQHNNNNNNNNNNNTGVYPTAAMVWNCVRWLAVVFFHFNTTTFQFRSKKYFLASFGFLPLRIGMSRGSINFSRSTELTF